MDLLRFALYPADPLGLLRGLTDCDHPHRKAEIRQVTGKSSRPRGAGIIIGGEVIRQNQYRRCLLRRLEGRDWLRLRGIHYRPDLPSLSSEKESNPIRPQF